MVLHFAFAVQFVARVQKVAVIVLADQFLELSRREAFAEIDLIEAGGVVAKPTLRFSAGCSGGFQVELHQLVSSLKMNGR
jgi:hypothetical protein